MSRRTRLNMSVFNSARLIDACYACVGAGCPSEPAPRQRSIMTNDPRRLDGVDMRTSAGRRYRDIVDQLAAEFGALQTVHRARRSAAGGFTEAWLVVGRREAKA
jgi:hypothetical protein